MRNSRCMKKKINGFCAEIQFTLNHEPTNVSMKQCAVIAAISSQGQKVEGRSGSGVTKNFQLEVANGSVQCHGHDGKIASLLRLSCRLDSE